MNSPLTQLAISSPFKPSPHEARLEDLISFCFSWNEKLIAGNFWIQETPFSNIGVLFRKLSIVCFVVFRVLFAPRSCNKIAHVLAGFGGAMDPDSGRIHILAGFNPSGCNSNGSKGFCCCLFFWRVHSGRTRAHTSHRTHTHIHIGVFLTHV